MPNEKELSIVECPVDFKNPEGQKFEKEILYEGSFAHPQNPNKKLVFDVKRFQNLVDNFNKKVVDIVYVPLNHSSNPKDNTGFVVELSIKDSIAKPGKKGLFAKISIALAEIAEKIGKTIKGCSVGLEQYINPETGKSEGEVLSHLALTNEPYIPNLGGYEALAFSKDDLVKIYFYRLQEDTEDNMAELAELEKKIAELEKKNREQAEKIEAEKKRADASDAEKVELEKVNFEAGVKSKVEKLVMSKKILPADMEKEIKFAISLEGKADEYLKNLSEKADVIDLSTKSKNGAETHKDKESTTLKASRLNKIFADFLLGKGDNKLNEKGTTGNFERAVNEWNSVMAELKDVKEVKLEMDVDGRIEFTAHPYRGKVNL